MTLPRLVAMVLSLGISTIAAAQSPIECIPDPPSTTTHWPSIYLSRSNELCFDVLGWIGFQGKNCVRNGGSIQWSGVIIVYADGESKGRDETDLRVRNAVVTPERIEYVIEWSRGAGWQPMQDIRINRLTGIGFNRFINEQGADTMRCQVGKKKL